jgi:hypothetical protein
MLLNVTFLLQENKIIKVQAFWRGCRVRKMFLSLFHQPQPPFEVVRSFAYHLDFSADDYRRDLQLQVKQIMICVYFFCLCRKNVFVRGQIETYILLISHWPLLRIV